MLLLLCCLHIRFRTLQRRGVRVPVGAQARPPDCTGDHPFGVRVLRPNRPNTECLECSSIPRGVFGLFGRSFMRVNLFGWHTPVLELQSVSCLVASNGERAHARFRYDIAFPIHSIPMKYVRDGGKGWWGGMRGLVCWQNMCVCVRSYVYVEVGGFLEGGVWCGCLC